MTVYLGVQAGPVAVSMARMSRGEQTQQGVDEASRTLSNSVHDAGADDRRRLDRPGSLDALLEQPSPLARFERSIER